MIRVLVVDDEPVVARALRRAARPARGLPPMRIDDCATAGEAIERVEDGRYDVLVVDRGLGDADGIELGRTLRASGYDSALLMVSGCYPEPESECAAFQATFDDFVRKPYDAGALLWRIAAMARRPRPSYLDLGEGAAHRPSGTTARRLVVVTDDPASARAAAEALSAAGYPRPEIWESAADLAEAGTPGPISIVAASGSQAALRACRGVRARALAGAILLFAAADGSAALDAQADRFWARQWGVERLGEAVRKWVRPWAVRIDAGGRVHLYGRELGLCDTPLLLACFLVRRAYDYDDRLATGRLSPGQLPVVTRDEMKLPVWGQKAVSDHTLDQTVYRIREVLAEVDPEERQRLRRVTGRGYWLDVT